MAGVPSHAITIWLFRENQLTVLLVACLPSRRCGWLAQDMSKNMRNGLTLLMLALLATSAFAAGYFAKDVISARNAAHAQEDFDVFWEAWSHVEGSFIGQLPDGQQRAHGAIRGSLAELQDPYTIFVEPVAREHEREQLQGIFGGIGAFITRPEGSDDVVLEPIPGNPAEGAGIVAGDVLIAVDGTQITPDMTVADVADLVKGEKGTTVVLTVIHPGTTEAVDVAVVRGDILIPSVTSQLLAEDERIGYIRLSRFSGESAGEVAEALRALQGEGADRFVLDLRQNRGGLLDAAVAVADHFLTAGPVLRQQSRDEGERVFSATSNTIAPDAPLVVLIDGGTASAAEIVAGAMQDRERGTLIGPESTFGKGSVQLVFDLSDGSSVHVTSARWLTPSGTALDGTGLEPDIIVEITQEAIDNGRDEVLGRAVEFLQNGS